MRVLHWLPRKIKIQWRKDRTSTEIKAEKTNPHQDVYKNINRRDLTGGGAIHKYCGIYNIKLV